MCPLCAVMGIFQFPYSSSSLQSFSNIDDCVLTLAHLIRDMLPPRGLPQYRSREPDALFHQVVEVQRRRIDAELELKQLKSDAAHNDVKWQRLESKHAMISEAIETTEQDTILIDKQLTKAIDNYKVQQAVTARMRETKTHDEHTLQWLREALELKKRETERRHEDLGEAITKVEALIQTALDQVSEAAGRTTST